MDTTGAIVIVLCAALIVAGAITIRLSRRRGISAIAIALGLIGILAWTTTEHGSPPPPNATPTHGLIATAPPTEDAP